MSSLKMPLPPYAIECPRQLAESKHTLDLFKEYVPFHCSVVSVQPIYACQQTKCKWKLKIEDLNTQPMTKNVLKCLKESLEVYKPRNTNISFMEPTIENYMYIVEYAIRGCTCDRYPLLDFYEVL